MYMAGGLFQTYIYSCKNVNVLDFPRGAVVKNLPANAGDMSSNPGLKRSHMPWSN